MATKLSESTIARMAGNILGGVIGRVYRTIDSDVIAWAVRTARAIAAEVERTAPKDEAQP